MQKPKTTKPCNVFFFPMRVWAALPFDSFACSFGYKLVATRLTRLRRNLPIAHFVNLLVVATSVKTLLNYSTFMALFIILNCHRVIVRTPHKPIRCEHLLIINIKTFRKQVFLQAF